MILILLVNKLLFYIHLRLILRAYFLHCIYNKSPIVVDLASY